MSGTEQTNGRDLARTIFNPRDLDTGLERLDLLTTQPAEWQRDLSTAREQLRAAAQRGPHGKWAPHPAFGHISGTLYGVFIYKHFDHHLRQFGA